MVRNALSLFLNNALNAMRMRLNGFIFKKFSFDKLTLRQAQPFDKLRVTIKQSNSPTINNPH